MAAASYTLASAGSLASIGEGNWPTNLMISVESGRMPALISSLLRSGMRHARLEDLVKGWFIGDFTPTVLRTSQFEVGTRTGEAGLSCRDATASIHASSQGWAAGPPIDLDICTSSGVRSAGLVSYQSPAWQRQARHSRPHAHGMRFTRRSGERVARISPCARSTER